MAELWMARHRCYDIRDRLIITLWTAEMRLLPRTFWILLWLAEFFTLAYLVAAVVAKSS